MRIVYFNAHLDAQARRPVELLRAWPTVCDVPDALVSAGGEVTVVQAAHEFLRLARGSVRYEFVDARDDGPARLAAVTAAAEPDVVHCNGFAFPHHVLALRAALPRCPIIVQDHGDRPPHRWKRSLWRNALACADGVAFTAAAQAQPFVRAGVLGAGTQVFTVPESAARFMPGDRAAARAASGIDGDPCVVTIARLNANKDPLTIARAFAAIAAHPAQRRVSAPR